MGDLLSRSLKPDAKRPPFLMHRPLGASASGHPIEETWPVQAVACPLHIIRLCGPAGRCGRGLLHHSPGGDNRHSGFRRHGCAGGVEGGWIHNQSGGNVRDSPACEMVRLREPVTNKGKCCQAFDSATMGTWCPNPPFPGRFAPCTLLRSAATGPGKAGGLPAVWNLPCPCD